jgi:hypothetical protein
MRSTKNRPAIDTLDMHGLYNRLTDGGDVVSLTRRLTFILQDDSWYSFLLEAETLLGHVAAGIRSNGI